MDQGPTITGRAVLLREGRPSALFSSNVAESVRSIDMIAIYMTGLATILLLLVPFIPALRDIPRLIPVHRLIWRSWYRSDPRGRRSRLAGPSAS
jgi:hypothetical protein